MGGTWRRAAPQLRSLPGQRLALAGPGGPTLGGRSPGKGPASDRVRISMGCPLRGKEGTGWAPVCSGAEGTFSVFSRQQGMQRGPSSGHMGSQMGHKRVKNASRETRFLSKCPSPQGFVVCTSLELPSGPLTAHESGSLVDPKGSPPCRILGGGELGAEPGRCT